MLFHRQRFQFSPIRARKSALRSLLLLALVLASPPSYGHGDGDNDDEGFECTVKDGTVLRSRLNANCAHYWPSCEKKIVHWPKKFPSRCTNPNFKVVRTASQRDDTYVKPKTYNTFKPKTISF